MLKQTLKPQSTQPITMDTTQYRQQVPASTSSLTVEENSEKAEKQEQKHASILDANTTLEKFLPRYFQEYLTSMDAKDCDRAYDLLHIADARVTEIEEYIKNIKTKDLAKVTTAQRNGFILLALHTKDWSEAFFKKMQVLAGYLENSEDCRRLNLTWIVKEHARYVQPFSFTQVPTPEVIIYPPRLPNTLTVTPLHYLCSSTFVMNQHAWIHSFAWLNSGYSLGVNNDNVHAAFSDGDLESLQTFCQTPNIVKQVVATSCDRPELLQELKSAAKKDFSNSIRIRGILDKDVSLRFFIIDNLADNLDCYLTFFPNAERLCLLEFFGKEGIKKIFYSGASIDGYIGCTFVAVIQAISWEARRYLVEALEEDVLYRLLTTGGESSADETAVYRLRQCLLLDNEASYINNSNSLLRNDDQHNMHMYRCKLIAILGKSLNKILDFTALIEILEKISQDNRLEFLKAIDKSCLAEIVSSGDNELRLSALIGPTSVEGLIKTLADAKSALAQSEQKIEPTSSVSTATSSSSASSSSLGLPLSASSSFSSASSSSLSAAQNSNTFSSSTSSAALGIQSTASLSGPFFKPISSSSSAMLPSSSSSSLSDSSTCPRKRKHNDNASEQQASKERKTEQATLHNQSTPPPHQKA